MDLNGIFIFSKVVQAGSFSGAARNLGVPKSTVSTKVSQLEERLGVTLIKRTTRKLHLTEAGQNYYRICSRVLTELEEAELGTTLTQDQPAGLLRLTATVEMGNTILPALLGKFASMYPKLDLELVLTDRVVDLVAENIDIAIRAGELQDSTLIAKKLGVSCFQAFASQSYLKKHGTPEKPQDLSQHECLRFTISFEDRVWELEKGSRKAAVHVAGRIAANSLDALKELVIAGQGIALLPGYCYKKEIERKELIPILPGWTTEQAPVHIVYPPHKFVPPKVRAFIEFFSDALKGGF